jgi:RTX calcium-binding nonapeptide repeat (4 copies)/BNR repeat-like domain
VPRLVVLALAALALLAFGAGPARPATIRGTLGPDRLVGTADRDVIFGRAGADRLDGRGGADLLDGGPGRDLLLGGSGDDRVAAEYDGSRDTVRCGAGRDVVTAELTDGVGPNCETVSRQLSLDPFTDQEAQHETQVEPDSYAVGSTIVTAFQVGRMVDGGASAIGFSTSRDAGVHWRSGFLPELTSESRPPGDAPSASDPVVAYDVLHGYWLIASVAESAVRVRTLVSRSRDGLAWSAPVVAAGDPAEDDDKEWLACDNGLTSPFRGRCYLSYLDARSAELRTRVSTDGGFTWSAPRLTAAGTELGFLNGAQPVVRPDGTLVVVFDLTGIGDHFGDPAANQIEAVRSTDGGRTFGSPVTVARVQAEDVRGVRAPTFPSVDVDSGGTIYAAWGDCRFRDACFLDDIVVSRSRDGVVWTPAERVPLIDAGSDVQVFVPGLAVDHTTAGSSAHVALVAYTQSESCASESCRGIDVAFVSSRNGGRSWTRPRRLNTAPMAISFLADTGLGRMLGDYVSTSYVRGRAIPVFALASEPFGGHLREAIYAATRIG